MWCSLSISNHMRLVDVHQVRVHSETSSDAFDDHLDEFTLALDNFILVLDQFVVVALNVSEPFLLAFDQLDKFTLMVDHFFLVVYQGMELVDVLVSLSYHSLQHLDLRQFRASDFHVDLEVLSNNAAVGRRLFMKSTL